MSPAPRTLRLLTVVWALLQLLLSPLASLADAAAERAGAAARTAHVEAAGERDCPPAHGADCVACRQLVASGMPTSWRAPAAVAAVDGVFRGEVRTTPFPRPEGASRPRAPPVAA